MYRVIAINSLTNGEVAVKCPAFATKTEAIDCAEQIQKLTNDANIEYGSPVRMLYRIEEV